MLAALLSTIPAPPFQNLDVGPVTLHGYGLVMGLAIIISLSVLDRGLRYQHVDTERLTTWAILTVICGFIGARLYHVASEPVRYFDHPGEIIEVWNGGLGIYGAVAGGAIAGLALANRFGIPKGAIADASAPALLIAQVLGRIGNYLNQELYGKPTDAWYGLEVERPFRPLDFVDTTYFQPTFAFEAGMNLLLAVLFVVLLVRWKDRAPGILFPLYVGAYSVVRIIVEPLRIDHANEWLGIRQNVWVAGTLIALALTAAVIMQRRYRRAHGSPTASPASPA
ncbi:MAG: Prolipoprotein diacylglyceryl transferase [Thermoleophilia bacterium]|nr:Prolipoprotein diacylglyceryl transferase [Thermoleophilia bacterium]